MSMAREALWSKCFVRIASTGASLPVTDVVDHRGAKDRNFGYEVKVALYERFKIL